MDCFRLRSSSYGGQVVAEPVIGRAFRATRWLLAMTGRAIWTQFSNSPWCYRRSRRAMTV